MRLGRAIVASLTLLVITGLVFGALTGFFGAFGPAGRAELQPAASSSDSSDSSDPSSDRKVSAGSEPPAAPQPQPGPTVEPQLPAPVLKVAATDGAVDPGLVSSRLATVNRKGLKGLVAGSVVDGAGRTVYAANAGIPMIPASTMKLLTSAAALSLYGPQHRFRTTVVAAGKRQIVLVGGGDPYLSLRGKGRQPARAALTDLAAATAAALKTQGRRSVTLGYDDTLFSGPAWNPKWPTRYRDQVSPTSPLWIEPKAPDAARSATQAFARTLRGRGIEVSTISRTKAPRSAATLAVVKSMTLQQIVTQLLQVSDNNATEVLLRQVGLKGGQGGSINGGRRVVRAQLTKLGLWAPGIRAYDGSGMARESKVPPATLARVLRLAGTPEHAQLRTLLTGLPVAGVEGSLRNRFIDATLHPADGLVRGKTGTLTGVRALAGYLRTPDGSLLYYSWVVNNAKDDYVAEIWIQQALVALTGCGCRR